MKSLANLIPDIIVSDPDIMSGAVCFKGTRVPVQTLFDFLEGGDTIERFLHNFPSVGRVQVVAVLETTVGAIIDAALDHPKAAA